MCKNGKKEGDRIAPSKRKGLALWSRRRGRGKKKRRGHFSIRAAARESATFASSSPLDRKRKGRTPLIRIREGEGEFAFFARVPSSPLCPTTKTVEGGRGRSSSITSSDRAALSTATKKEDVEGQAQSL